ncbi:MAG: cofactor-independent phosphoglycerate mutase [Nitrososphaerota archaeon]|jgi:2,3-bisphosphoglycerate-independent phosphoglycerate mutase|nr:cofactor-independent phosphoglycerate mutase [Nitrososphaerota archaeon]
MKYILIIGDGMSDYPIPELGNKTPLQAAIKPHMDTIAVRGQSGLIKNVPDGCTPGSDVAICSVLSYNPRIYCTGRGALEAPSRNINLGADDTAYRCNIITEENGAITDYSAGHITTEEANQLIAAVKKAYNKPGEVEFYPGLDYRHFLILRNFPHPEQIYCSPPHDVIGQATNEVMPKAKVPEAENNTQQLRDMIEGSRSILRKHPVNLAREKAGKKPGNLIWPWGGGKKPSMPTLKEKFGIKSAVISAVDLVKGLGTYAGMDIINVEGATGLYNTNYEGKADAAIKALETHDLVCVHVEAPDEAGHTRDYKLKVRTIEDLDKRLLGRILSGIKEPYAIAILPDHPTPVKIGTHTHDPVPFTIAAPNLKPDDVKTFDEFSVKQGKFGLVEKDYLLSILLSIDKS